MNYSPKEENVTDNVTEDVTETDENKIIELIKKKPLFDKKYMAILI